MKKHMKLIGLFLFFITAQITYAQTNKEKALTKAQEAVTLMDNGKVDESIKLLKEAITLDPDNYNYTYELAYAYYLKQDYKQASQLLEQNKNHKDVNERLYQLLGNSYDMLGESTKALAAYDEGLQKFPNSGMMYLEKGNVYWGKQDFNKALPFYEKGIEVDPKFSSNYYRATRIYCSSTEEVWGMIYGEIFMNLERNSKRTAEISKLLYDTYKSQIKFTGKNSFSVSFSQNATITINDLSDTSNIKLPYGVGVYEPTLSMSILTEKVIDINSLDRIRKSFVELYYKNGNGIKYPNALFDYQNKVLQAGHMEAYNHWILMKGDEEGFTKWQTSNKDKWDAFVKWFSSNGMVLNSSNKFYRGQY